MNIIADQAQICCEIFWKVLSVSKLVAHCPTGKTFTHGVGIFFQQRFSSTPLNFTVHIRSIQAMQSPGKIKYQLIHKESFRQCGKGSASR